MEADRNAMLSNRRATPSPRAALHVKTARSGGEATSAQDDHRGLPASHGRRLMQMIFRSNNEEEAKTTVREAVVLTSPVALHGDARSEDDVVPVGSTKLSALKRKLFPSRKRRHPARIPPLVISPINAGVSAESQQSGNNVTEDDAAERDEQQHATRVSVVEEPQDHDVWPGGDDDIDDDLLEAIEEADRLQSTTSDETLAQMSRAIDDLHQWKAKQELATQSALKAMEANAENDATRLTPSVQGEEEEEDNAAALREDAEHNQRVAEAARAKLSLTLKETEASMAAGRKGNQQVTRVLEEVTRQVDLGTSQIGTKPLAKLQEEVFNLGVQELSSKLQASWLHELEGADDELDMKRFDVEAYASDLDSVLAQFDAVGSNSGRDTEQYTAGQMAQEH